MAAVSAVIDTDDDDVINAVLYWLPRRQASRTGENGGRLCAEEESLRIVELKSVCTNVYRDSYVAMLSKCPTLKILTLEQAKMCAQHYWNSLIKADSNSHKVENESPYLPDFITKLSVIIVPFFVDLIV